MDEIAEFLAATMPGASLDDARFHAIAHDFTDPGTSAWAARVDGEIRAVVAAHLRHVASGDPEYTYMPPAYALTRMSMWHVAADEDWAYVPDLLDHIARDAAFAGIQRLSVDVPAADATALRTLLGAGYEPDVILAARATRPASGADPPGVHIRRARDDDAEALLALTLEEANYHAHHTASGIVADQDPEPSREHVRQWLANERDRNLPTFVAEAGGAVVGMLPLMIMDDAPGLVAGAYGYLASTCVTATARGKGTGTALVERALGAAHERGMAVVLLHYVADNLAAARLWEGFGFEPITVTLTRVGLNGGGHEGEGSGTTA